MTANMLLNNENLWLVHTKHGWDFWKGCKQQYQVFARTQKLFVAWIKPHSTRTSNLWGSHWEAQILLFLHVLLITHNVLAEKWQIKWIRCTGEDCSLRKFQGVLFILKQKQESLLQKKIKTHEPDFIFPQKLMYRWFSCK